MKYRNKRSFNSVKHQSRKRLYAVLSILFLLIVTAGILLYDRGNRIDYNPDEVTTSTQTKTTVASKNTQFTTAYFMFTAPKTWQFDQKSSTTSMYVYRDMRDTLLRQQLIIYVNPPARSESITYVLPLTVTGSAFSVGALSEHCGKPYGYHRPPAPIIVQGVTIECAGDASEYTVAVGTSSGNSTLTLPRPGGDNATYRIRYSNLEALPSGANLIDIMHSFRAL